MEAERIVGTSESSPAADVFRTLVSTFKSNVDDFMFRAEQRYKELDTVVHVYRFCDKVCVKFFSTCVLHPLDICYLLLVYIL